MTDLLDHLTRPDNLPIVAMVVVLGGLLWVWLSQALRHDKLIEEGREDEIGKEMRR
jgi:hypothetical protein